MTNSPAVDPLVVDEIRRRVAAAIKDGGILAAQQEAAEVLRQYPNCGLTQAAVGDMVMMAAASAGVAVEIGSADLPKEE